jgi:malate/lactate dehydrogenase
MTRLDQNRAAFQLANKADVKVADVSHMTIWGNHSATLMADFFHAKIKDEPALSVITDLKWLENEFISLIQKRGAAIIQARGKSSAGSAATAIINAVRDLTRPTTPGEWYSSAVLSQGNPYGIANNLIFSFPCRSIEGEKWEIVPELFLNDFLQEKLKITEKELMEERDLVKHLILI